MRLRLQEADRKRLGCPEFLPISLTSITNREAIQLKKLGFPTVRLLAKSLQKDVAEYEAWTAMVWLALRRAGTETDPNTLEYALPVEILDDEQPPEPPDLGKAEEAPEASTT